MKLAFLGALLSLVILASPSSDLVSHFNSVRSVPLKVDGPLTTKAQAYAQLGVDTCTFPQMSGFSGTAWQSYGYKDAAALWAIYQTDATMVARIKDPKYLAVGVGFAPQRSGCNTSPLWVIILSTKAAVTPTPIPRTPTPLPTCSLVQQALNLLRQAADLPTGPCP